MKCLIREPLLNDGVARICQMAGVSLAEALTMATVFAVVTAVGYRVIDASTAVPRPRRVPQQLVRADKMGSFR